MEKRMFQVLDEMNVLDIQNGTKTLEISNSFISGDKIRQGAKIAMGAPKSCLFDIISEKKIPILLLVDKEQYFKLKEKV